MFLLAAVCRRFFFFFSPIHSLVRSLRFGGARVEYVRIQSFRKILHSFIRSWARTSIYDLLFIHSLLRWCAFIHSFVRSFIHSLLFLSFFFSPANRPAVGNKKGKKPKVIGLLFLCWRSGARCFIRQGRTQRHCSTVSSVQALTLFHSVFLLFLLFVCLVCLDYFICLHSYFYYICLLALLLLYVFPFCIFR